MEQSSPVIGLVPAAGRGSRLAPLPCSKEVLPLGTRVMPDGAVRPKVLIHYLLEAYLASGIDRAAVVVGESKWDVAEFLTAGGACGVNVAYLGVESSPGTPFSLDHAYPWSRDRVCALGFPDILLPVEAPFRPLLATLGESSADVVLGLFPAENPRAADVVEVDAEGRLTSLVPKPAEFREPCLTWSAAVWGPRLTEFMHRLLAPAWHSAEARASLVAGSAHGELFVGDVFNLAAGAGLEIRGVLLSDRPSLDVGTTEAFNRAVALAAGSGLPISSGQSVTGPDV